MAPAMLPAAQRIRQQCQRQHAGEQHHQGREPVRHQHDAEVRRPVADAVDRGLRALDGHHVHQRGAGQHQHRARDDAQRQHRAPALLADQQLQRGRQQRDQDRRDDQMLAHGVPSSPST
ncbi:hypothetical protein [Rhodanobacter lindaniclasticus]